jgi:hypothetical protein
MRWYIQGHRKRYPGFRISYLLKCGTKLIYFLENVSKLSTFDARLPIHWFGNLAFRANCDERIDFVWAGLLIHDYLMRSTVSLGVSGLPVDLCFSTFPVSLNWVNHRVTDLSVGASVLYVGRKLRCTVTIYLKLAYHSTHCAFCWKDAISLTDWG